MFRPSRVREAVERLVFVAAAVVLFVMIPFDTQAQTEAQAQAEPAVETIVITGTKRKEARQNTLQSVQVLREDDVRNLADAFDALLALPNLSSNTRSALPSVRGLDGNGTSYGGGGAVTGGRPRLGTYVDGVPRAYSFAVDGAASLWDVQQVEVYRGAQSTTLGRNAAAGAMVIATRDPEMHNSGAIELGVRSERRTLSAAAMANVAINDDHALRLTTEGRHGDNWRTPVGSGFEGTDLGRLERQDAERTRIKWLFAPQALPGLTLRLTHDRERNASPSSVDTVIGPDYARREINAPLYALFIKRNAVTSLQASYALGGGWQAEAIAARQDARNDGPAPTANPDFLDVFARTTEHSFEPRLSYSAAQGRSSAVVGAYLFERDRVEGGSPGSSFVYSATDRAKTRSLFGDMRWQIAQAWDVIAGARWERERQRRIFNSELGLAFDLDQTAQVFLPKLGVDHHLSPDMTLGALVYRGYTAGGGGASFLTFTPYTFDKEFITTAELVLRSQWLGKRLTVNANLFHSRFKDVQLAGAGPQGLEDQIIVNAQRARSSGLEVDAQWRPGARLTLAAGLGLLRTRIDQFGDPVNDANNGREFGNAPRYTASLAAQWAFTPALRAGIALRHSARYFSDYSNDDTGRIPAYTLLDLTAQWQWAPLLLSAYVNNATGRDAITARSVDAFGDSAQMVSPRTVGVKARWAF